MASDNLNKVLEQVGSLTIDERRQLRHILDAWSASPSAATKEDELDRRLLEAGLITRIPPFAGAAAGHQNRQPIVVKGKPLSETIIEERR